MELKYFSFFVFLTVSIAIFSKVVRRIDEEFFYKEKKESLLIRQKSLKPHIFDFIKLKKLIGMSGVTISIEKLYIYKVVSSAVTAAISLALFHNIIFFLPAIVGGFFIPNFWLKKRKEKRQKELLEQLPETLERIANYLKSGSSIGIALEKTKENEITIEPMKTELIHILADIRKGMTVSEAINKAAEERITLSEFRMVSMATEIHTELGGNMAETFENISKTIKDKKELIETIRVSTTEARLSGWIVGIVPVLAFLGIKLLYPNFTEEAMKVPTANLLYAVAFIWDALGLLLTRKMADVSKDVREQG